MVIASSLHYTIDWKLLLLCLQSGISRIPITLELTFFGMGISLIIGLFVALVRFFKIPVISQVFTIFVTVIKGIPIILIMLIISLIYSSNISKIINFFHLNMAPSDVNMIYIGVFVLALGMIPITSEIFRGALFSIDKVQFEAGYTVGFTKSQLLRRIILPQVIPTSMPALMNILVASFKSSALVYTMGIFEVMYGALAPCAKYYRYLEGYIAAAIIFWVFSILMTFFGNWVTHVFRIEKNSKECRI